MINSADQSGHLWYREPAGTEWTRALPLGAGRLGAMVFGNVAEERIQLNEDSVWAGGPRDRINPDALATLPEIRRLLFAGRLAEAHTLTLDALSGIPDSMRHYEPLGDLLLSFAHNDEATTEYERELDLNDAVVRVRYRVGATTYTREHLTSNPDQVFAMRITADQPGALSLHARIQRGPMDSYSSRYSDTLCPEDGCALTMSGAASGEGGVRFACTLRATVEGGTLRSLGETLIIEGADAVTLVLAAATSYREADPGSISRSRVQHAAAQGWAALRARHLEEYQPYFNRVELSLAPHADDRGGLPTDERLARVREGAVDAGLDALYFHYGRYLLIACSRPGSLAANLQGIWNDSFTPSWGSKYTININTQMNYWPAESCNLPEMTGPLFDLVEGIRVNGRKVAREMYNCRGFVCHHNTDLWHDCTPTDRNLSSSFWPMGGAWLSLHLWEHFAFTGDRAFLARSYDTLKEASLFFLDFLVEDAKGRLVTSPTSSPENTYLLPNGEQGTLCAGASMDCQILEMLFRACLQAGETLDVDTEFRQQIETARLRLPQPSIGQHGQLMEWPEDFAEIEVGHRHISHLFALYPGDMISPLTTPELATAARTTLERRLAHGGGHTGWSRAWIINFWARLQDSTRAYANLQALLAKSTLPNLFDDHPPFQIDGNFGGTAGIVEMLLQSHQGELHLLPALPDAWPQGMARGLCARGGFILEFHWADGDLTSLTLHSLLGGPCRLRTGAHVQTYQTTPGETLTLDGLLQPIGE